MPRRRPVSHRMLTTHKPAHGMQSPAPVQFNHPRPHALDSCAGISPAGKAFAQSAPHAASRYRLGYHELRFALPAETFLPWLHGSSAGRHDHGTKLDAAFTFLAGLWSNTKGEVPVAIFAPADKANCPGTPHLCADTYATAAQHTVIVAERVPNVSHPAAQRNILNGARVGGLGHQQLRQVVAQSPNPVRVGPDHHALFHLQGA